MRGNPERRTTSSFGSSRLILRVLLLTLILSVSGTRSHASSSDDRFSLTRTDHQLHMLATYGISFTMTRMLTARKMPRWKAVFLSSLTTMAFSYGKEKLYDSTYQRGDMVANGIGVATQAVVVFSFQL